MSATLLSAARPFRILLLAAACLAALTLTCAADTTVSVIVRGPWAYAILPQNGSTQGQLILIAPQDSFGHYNPSILYKGGELSISLGKNALSFYPRGAGTSHTAAPAKCNADALNGYDYKGLSPNALNSLINTLISARSAYLLSLPIPDDCAPAQTAESDVRTNWGDSNEHHATYATDMVFTYSGPTQFYFPANSGSPYDFEGGNIIDVWMQPRRTLPPFCDMDSRHAFHMLSKTLSLDSQLFEDFPGRGYRNRLCLALDEQNHGYAKALNKHFSDFAYQLNYFQAPPGILKQAELIGTFVLLVKEAKKAGLSDHSLEYLSMEKLLTKYDGQSTNMIQAKFKNQLQRDFDTIVHIFLDGAGSCRKAIIHLDPS